MKKILSTLSVAACLAAATTVAQAQIGIGFRAGILTTREVFNDDESDVTVVDDESVTGYMFGVPIEIGLSKVFSLQPEINFQRRGSSKVNEFNFGSFGRTRQSIERHVNYLDIPLLFKLGYISERFSLAAVAGPSFSYALGGTTEVSDYIVVGSGQPAAGGTVAGEYDIDFDQEGTRRAEFGGHLGGQLGVPLGGGKVILDGRYQFGFTNLNDGRDSNNDQFSDYETRSRGLSFTLGYMLTLGDY